MNASGKHGGSVTMERQREARRLLDAGALDEARELCDQVLKSRPAAWQPHLLLAHIALRCSDAGKARSHLDAARVSGAPDLPLARVDHAVALQEGSARCQLNALQRLIVLEPENPRWRALAFRRLTACVLEDAEAGDEDIAWDTIVEACRIHPEATLPQPLQQAIGLWISEDPTRLQRVERSFEENPGVVGLLWCLAIILDVHGEPERSRRLVNGNWDWAARHGVPPQLSVWSYLDPDAIMESARPDPALRYQAYQHSNRLEEAIECAPAWHRPLLQQALALSDSGVDSMPPLRSHASLVVHGTDRPNGTVIVFTGVLDQAWIPLHVMDLFFARLGLRAIFLRDSNRLAVLSGIPGLADSVPDAARELRKHLPAAGGPVYTLGLSAGGLAAIAYAEQLAADASLVFSPPTTMDPAICAQIGEGRARAWHRRFLSLVDHRPFDAPTIVARMPASFRLTAFAGAESHEDRAHVERLAGQSRVTLRLLEGVKDHNSLAHAAANAGMLEVFQDAWCARKVMP